MDAKSDKYHFDLLSCLGEQIARRRKRLGMSQEELSAAAQVDRAFISKVEQGRRNPSFVVVARIARGLDMSYERLVRNCQDCVLRAHQEATAKKSSTSRSRSRSPEDAR